MLPKGLKEEKLGEGKVLLGGKTFQSLSVGQNVFNDNGNFPRLLALVILVLLWAQVN